MSAWAELVNADGSDEWLEKCEAALLEVQAETRRRAAAQIRAQNWHEGCEGVGCCADTPEMAADLIDPEVE